MKGITLTPLKQIYNPKGDIFHALKCSESTFSGFGEAYFSTILKDEIKGWKKHKLMNMNLVVPQGEIEFVIFDEDSKEFFSVILSPSNYQRLSVKANLWMAFRGIGEFNLLLNIADMEHDFNECERVELKDISYEWK